MGVGGGLFEDVSTVEVLHDCLVRGNSGLGLAVGFPEDPECCSVARSGRCTGAFESSVDGYTIALLVLLELVLWQPLVLSVVLGSCSQLSSSHLDEDIIGLGVVNF